MDPGRHKVKEVVQQTFGVRPIEQAEPDIKDSAAAFQLSVGNSIAEIIIVSVS